MPTAAKLVAAALLAGLGFYVAGLISAHLPEEVPGRGLVPVLPLFGAAIGWKFLGPRVGGGMQSALGLGISAVVALALVSLLYFAGYEMLKRAMRMAYGGNPFEALQDMIQIGMELTQHVVYSDVITASLVGGVIVGLVTEAINRRWP